MWVELVMLVLQTVGSGAVFVAAARAMSKSSGVLRTLWAGLVLASGLLILDAVGRFLVWGGYPTRLPSPWTLAFEVWGQVEPVLTVGCLLVVLSASMWIMDLVGRSERLAGAFIDRARRIAAIESSFTKRELEVLVLIGEGWLNDEELADRLHISQWTVQSHVKSILRKSNLRRRHDLIGLALLLRE